ncbi:MAG: mechanosensitive ion channel [Chitinivibrionales bacterium]|nr:mechanosensitive ion channel [Chitinivibrionales bacterium]
MSRNELRTLKTLNGLLLHKLNYYTNGANLRLILHTTVTIGYDVPWRTVHQLLIASALSTSGISKEIEPFVLQKSLDDFYVSYEVNAYTVFPNKMAVIYSVLHRCIQDNFNAAGAEIMSPHYRAWRDGTQSTVPGSSGKANDEINHQKKR